VNRIEFTSRIGKLILYGNELGYDLVLDWVLRDADTQHRLYLKGASKCDGIKNRSRHQDGLAADIYIIEDGKIVNEAEPYLKLHEYWDSLGGESALMWDIGHFEVSKHAGGT
jgi:hypothetical protein